MKTRMLALGLAAICILNPALADVTNQAGAIFWTDVDETAGSPNHSLKRANSDGSGISNVVTGLSHPRGMTADPQGGKIYWTEPGLLAIRRANFDGTGVETVISNGQNGTAGVVLDMSGGKMYWTDSNNEGVNSKVRRANLDGSNPEDLVTSGLGHPTGIAVDPLHGKVYWTDLQGIGAIQRANLDGSEVETIVSGVGQANGLALDPVGGKLYWPELIAGKIQRANLDGSGVEDLVSGLGTPTTIGLDLPAGKMYWTDSGPPAYFNRIQRANLDGSGVEVIVSGVGFPWGIAVVPELPPLCITTQPSHSIVSVGSNAAFTVTATGIGPLNYQWRKDGMNLPGATNNVLALTNVHPVNIGDYSVVVSHAGGSVTSSNASLTIPGVPSGIWRGLMAYYPFNGNANDESGFGNNGVITTCQLQPDRFAQPDNAYGFNGADSTIVAPDRDYLNLSGTDFTISIWATRSASQPFSFILGKDAGNRGFPSTKWTLIFGPYHDPATPTVTFHYIDQNGSLHWVGSAAIKNDFGVWHHYTVSRSGDAYSIFEDGLLIETVNDTGILPSANPAGLTIGSAEAGGWHNGLIDEVRIYNRALSYQEVQQLQASEWPDADKDGLSDYEEINIYHTDPNKRDTDGDGLSDWQEIMVHHTDPLNSDTDGDGYSDYAEIYAGKDPKNLADFPSALLSLFTAIELEFITKTNQTYFIQASSNLVTWTNYEGPIIGDGGIWKKTYPSRAQGKLFYRVEKTP